MIQNRNTFYELNNSGSKIMIQSPHEIKLMERKGENGLNEYPSYPWSFGTFRDDTGFGICDFYLKY